MPGLVATALILLCLASTPSHAQLKSVRVFAQMDYQWSEMSEDGRGISEATIDDFQGYCCDYGYSVLGEGIYTAWVEAFIYMIPQNRYFLPGYAIHAWLMNLPANWGEPVRWIDEYCLECLSGNESVITSSGFSYELIRTFHLFHPPPDFPDPGELAPVFLGPAMNDGAPALVKIYLERKVVVIDWHTNNPEINGAKFPNYFRLVPVGHAAAVFKTMKYFGWKKNIGILHSMEEWAGKAAADLQESLMGIGGYVSLSQGIPYQPGLNRTDENPSLEAALRT